MWKAVMVVLASLMAVWLMVCALGANRLATTAVSVPATEHTSGFPITWTLVALCACLVVFWRVAKS